MLEIYKTLEKEVEELELIENWSDRVNKMKEIKEQITTEQQKLNDLVNIIVKDNINIYSDKKKKNKLDLETLVNNFKYSENLDDKIKYYHLIQSYVNKIEKQLFN
jgi:CII-binding regulator of phage lambda lysogenization HflD